MRLLSAGLTVVLVVACMSLVTSRQQHRLDFSAIEQEQSKARRLEQDFQNLTVKQQQLEQTERIARVAREDRQMESIPAARTVFVTQSVLQGVADSKSYVRATTPAQRSSERLETAITTPVRP
jgi:cell division protein FtsL